MVSVRETYLGEYKMKKVEVVIEGISPLLMHSAQAMTKQTSTKNPAKQYDPEEDAEKVAYRNDKGELYIPSRCIKAAILNAAAWVKFGKKSAKPVIAGSVAIEPYEIKLIDSKDKPLKKYVIDLRPVVVQRSRIMRARPRIDKWRLKFNLVYNEEYIMDADILRRILEDAGARIGLLDNRPQKYGENGTFKLVKFLPVGKKR